MITIVVDCDNPKPTVSGNTYVPDELFSASSFEQTREPYNARLEYQGDSKLFEQKLVHKVNMHDKFAPVSLKWSNKK